MAEEHAAGQACNGMQRDSQQIILGGGELCITPTFKTGFCSIFERSSTDAAKCKKNTDMGSVVRHVHATQKKKCFAVF